MSVYSSNQTLTTPAHQMAQASWLPIIRGIVSILFGATAIFFPSLTIAVFVMLFGIYSTIDGIIALVGAVRMAGRHRPFLWQLFEGLIGVIVGIVAFVSPVAFAAAIVTFIGIWAIITGVFAIVTAIHIRQHVPGEWAQMAGGVFSILLGILLFALPTAGLVAWSWMIGIYAIIFGTALVLLGVRLRKAANPA